MRKEIEVASKIVFIIYIVSVCVVCFARFDFGTELAVRMLFGIPQDKIIHFLMFLPFPALTYTAFYRPKGKPWRLVLFVSAVLVAGIAGAAGTEVIQGLTGYRSMDINDFRADCTGLFCGSLATVIYGAVTKRW